MKLPTAIDSTNPGRPTISTLLKYIRGHLNKVECEIVDEQIQANPEFIKILEGLKYRIEKHGKKAEKEVLFGSLKTLKQILILSNYKKLNRESSVTPKVKPFKFEMNEIINLENIFVVSGSGIVVALSFPYSKYTFENFGVYSIFTGYLLIFFDMVISWNKRTYERVSALPIILKTEFVRIKYGILGIQNAITPHLNSIKFEMLSKRTVLKLISIKIPYLNR